MIDTITIFTTNFYVKADNLLEIVLKNYDKSKFNNTKYFFTYDGSYQKCFAYEVKGECDGFRFRIYNIGNDICSFSSSLNISFELPTIFYGNNLNPIKIDQFTEMIIKIKNVLEKVGIVADLETFQVKRTDFFKNILLDHKTEEYEFILNYLKYIRSGSLALNEETLSKGNKSYEIKIYEKDTQISNKFNIDFKPFKEKSLARVEISLKNKEICDRRFQKVQLLNNIHAFFSLQGWRKLKKLFNNEINEIFYLDFQVGNVDCYDDLLNAELLTQRGQKPNRVAALLAFSKHFNNGNFEQLIKIIHKKNPSGISQYRKNVIQEIVDNKLYPVSAAIKYNELKAKLLFDPELKSHIKKYSGKNTNIISSNEKFLVTRPDYFVNRKKAKNNFKTIDISSLFYPERQKNEIQS